MRQFYGLDTIAPQALDFLIDTVDEGKLIANAINFIIFRSVIMVEVAEAQKNTARNNHLLFIFERFTSRINKLLYYLPNFILFLGR